MLSRRLLTNDVRRTAFDTVVLNSNNLSHVRQQVRSNSSMAAENVTSPAFVASSDPAKSTPPLSNPFELGLKKPEFKKLEATRPEFQTAAPVEVSQTPDIAWKYGQGVNTSLNGLHKHVEIDPYGPDRQMFQNYKLLISSIPRPISFVSTVSKDGERNLAPFSYFQVVDHDPPIFVIGFSGRASRPKDTRRNLEETGECVISVVTENMIEAVNATSVDIPHGASEWEVSGLSELPSATVKPKRVAEALFSVEGKVLEIKELDYGGEKKSKGKPSGALAIIRGTRFWVRGDALKGDDVDLEVLRPLVQLGGISYGRVRETFELPRPKLAEELEDKGNGLNTILAAQKAGQSC